MRELNEIEVAEISGGSGGVQFQIGQSSGIHVRGDFGDLGEMAYRYGRVAPLSGFGAGGLIWKHIMMKYGNSLGPGPGLGLGKRKQNL